MLRIEYAKKLLLTTDLPIEEVIWQCGYSNKGFFYKKFRESTGCTPMHFRTRGGRLIQGSESADLRDSESDM